MTVALGGWKPVRDSAGNIRKDLSPWFSLRLDESSAPWAFSRGLPARTISALEMLASTVALMLLPGVADGLRQKRGTVWVTGFTDSQVSANVVRRGMTTSFPLCCVVMELAAQLEARDAELILEWAPRDLNAEADALADGRADGFDPALRAEARMEDLPWMLLPALVKAGADFHRNQKELQRAERGPAETGQRTSKRQKAGPKLRDRDPW